MSGFNGMTTPGLTKADIVNNLSSTATNAPLSANMGKTLNDKIANDVTPTYSIDSSSSASLGNAINATLKSFGSVSIGKPFTFGMYYDSQYYFGIACYSLSTISFGRLFSLNAAYVYSFRNNNADSAATVNTYIMSAAT